MARKEAKIDRPDTASELISKTANRPTRAPLEGVYVTPKRKIKKIKSEKPRKAAAFRLPEELLEALQKRAEEEELSKTDIIEHLIIEYLERG